MTEDAAAIGQSQLCLKLNHQLSKNDGIFISKIVLKHTPHLKDVQEAGCLLVPQVNTVQRHLR